MKIKTNEYGNVTVVDNNYVKENNLMYVDTIDCRKYDSVDIYENYKGQKFGIPVYD